MFEERKLLKLMEKDCEERRERNLQRLKEMHPELFPAVEKSENKKFNKKWFGLIIPTVSVTAGLAIVLPVVLVGNNTIIPNEPINRYCNLSEYSYVQVQDTIKEYNESNNAEYNYFNWYDVSEGVTSFHYIDNLNNEVLGVSESMYNLELDLMIELRATPKNIYLEDLENTRSTLKNEKQYEDSTIYWKLNYTDIIGVIEHNDYRYFVTLFYSNDENQLFTLIEELLQ